MNVWRGNKVGNTPDLLSPALPTNAIIKKFVIKNTAGAANTITVKIIRNTVEAIIYGADLDDGDFVIEEIGHELLLGEKVKLISTGNLDFNFSFDEEA